MELNKISAMIQRRHPEYMAKLEHWNFLQSTYEGGRKWFDSNIFKYLKEGSDEFKERVKRAYRFNHSREIVDLINKYVFRGEIIRQKEDTPDSIVNFWGRATRRDVDISTYMRYISKLSSIFGRIWVVVDSVNLGSGESKKEADVRIYSYEVTPQNALDMSFDEAGNLNWILIRETGRDDTDPLNCTGRVFYRYRLWTRSEWFLFEPNGVIVENGKEMDRVELSDQGEHNLGIVPVFPVDHMISESEFTSPSLIDDIAYLDRAVANYLSNLDAIIQDQTFSQLAMPAQGLLPGEDDHTKLIEAGTKRIFTFDGEASSPPFYLSPDPKQAQMLITAIKQIINEIYHSVGVAGERTKQDNSMGIDNSSGVAKAYDFDRVNSLLVAKSASLEQAEVNLMKLVLLWSGKEQEAEELNGFEKQSYISYPSSFDARSLYDELDITNRIELLTAPIEMKRYQLKRLADKLYPYMSKSDREALESSIDAMQDATESLIDKYKSTMGSLKNNQQTDNLKDDAITNEAETDK